METSKYYTPDISEFHVGFEYEVNRPKGDWTKVKIIDVYDIVCVEKELKESIIRVKYLDKEDIESLGFVMNEFCLFQNKHTYISIFVSNRLDKYIQINHSSKSVFNGFIKNKSELINQLKRCNICVGE